MLPRGFTDGGNEGFIKFLLLTRQATAEGESIVPDASFAEPRTTSLIAPTNSLLQRIHRARFEKRYGVTSAARRDYEYTRWETPSNLHAVQPRRVQILNVFRD